MNNCELVDEYFYLLLPVTTIIIFCRLGLEKRERKLFFDPAKNTIPTKQKAVFCSLARIQRWTAVLHHKPLMDALTIPAVIFSNNSRIQVFSMRSELV